MNKYIAIGTPCLNPLYIHQTVKKGNHTSYVPQNPNILQLYETISKIMESKAFTKYITTRKPDICVFRVPVKDRIT